MKLIVFAKLLVDLQDNKIGVVSGGNDSRIHDTRFTSITYSYGDGLLIEATSLAAYAWMKTPTEYIEPIEKAMKWLYTRCKDGAFGSTQSTILALKAIVRYDILHSMKKPGTLAVSINGTEVTKLVVNYAEKDSNGAIEFELSKYFNKPGNYKITLKSDDGLELPYSVAVNYNTIKPDNDDSCEVELSTKLSSNEFTEGDGGEIDVVMKNLNKKTRTTNGYSCDWFTWWIRTSS